MSTNICTNISTNISTKLVHNLQASEQNMFYRFQILLVAMDDICYLCTSKPLQRVASPSLWIKALCFCPNTEYMFQSTTPCINQRKIA